MTAPMVAAGAVAKKWLLEKYGTVFRGCMTQIGEVAIPFEDWAHVPQNPFFAPVADVAHLEAYMDALRKAGDSCGASDDTKVSIGYTTSASRRLWAA